MAALLALTLAFTFVLNSKTNDFTTTSPGTEITSRSRPIESLNKSSTAHLSSTNGSASDSLTFTLVVELGLQEIRDQVAFIEALYIQAKYLPDQGSSPLPTSFSHIYVFGVTLDGACWGVRTETIEPLSWTPAILMEPAPVSEWKWFSWLGLKYDLIEATNILLEAGFHGPWERVQVSEASVYEWRSESTVYYFSSLHEGVLKGVGISAADGSILPDFGASPQKSGQLKRIDSWLDSHEMTS